MKTRKLFDVLAILLTLVIILACGKKGSPKAPELFAPDQVKFFAINGQLEGLNLTWQAPEKAANGDDLLNLETFLVNRRAVEGKELGDFEIIAEVPSAETPGVVKSEKATIYSYLDQSVVPGKEYDYYVVGVNTDGVKGVFSLVYRVRFVGEASSIRILNTTR
ncbi:MAG: hypothetical protein IT292_02675 [Deltaproteobacteria bacterium]|nr:hypothetical protein [Deltaproteobacteria bacterium]